ncbi:MAG TPA: hypothetical protein VMG08_01520 [Allosphingosinicella sp.]|nr:hypothetical protein [Allosphingosinicella sp.]
MTLIGGSGGAWWPNQQAEVRVSREQLYDLAWSAPMRQLAAEFGLSDSGLAKALRKQGIPLPQPGYWNKLQAGKPVLRTPLPARKPGQDSLLLVYGALADRFRAEPAAVESPEGPFASDAVPEDLDQLRRDILRQIGKISVSRKLERPHLALQALLRRDERRREKIAGSTYPRWELAPVFDQPDQERKLRIANSLMLALAPLGCPCLLSGEHEPSFRATVGDHNVRVQIQHPGEPTPTHRRHGDALPSPKAPLRIELFPALPEGFPRMWEDGAVKLEALVSEIAAAIVAAGEARHRLSIAERIAHEARMNAWREERRQEESAKRNKERLEALHRSAEMLRQAENLRALIASVSAAIENGRQNLDPVAFAEWREWAAAEADRLDPVISGQVDEHLFVTAQ